MAASTIRLTVPAQPAFARSVRMMAANLAVLCAMSVDDVEDARMAAEEAFVYSCATKPSQCDISFLISENSLGMEFVLGDAQPSNDPSLFEQVALAELLLSAVSDEYEIDEANSVLRVSKLVGGAHAE